MPFFFKCLAESEHYKVESEHETVRLRFKDHPNLAVTIGDFYGDPTCAMISANEKYVVMGGCGLIVYYLKPPFESYCYGRTNNQYKEFFREANNIWWIEAIYQSDIDNVDNDWSVFKFVVNGETGDKIYKMDVATGIISSA